MKEKSMNDGASILETQNKPTVEVTGHLAQGPDPNGAGKRIRAALQPVPVVRTGTGQRRVRR